MEGTGVVFLIVISRVVSVVQFCRPINLIYKIKSDITFIRWLRSKIKQNFSKVKIIKNDWNRGEIDVKGRV